MLLSNWGGLIWWVEPIWKVMVGCGLLVLPMATVTVLGSQQRFLWYLWTLKLGENLHVQNSRKPCLQTSTNPTVLLYSLQQQIPRAYDKWKLVTPSVFPAKSHLQHNTMGGTHDYTSIFFSFKMRGEKNNTELYFLKYLGVITAVGWRYCLSWALR